MSEPLRIGIVGAGANTRARHLPGFQEIDGVEVAVVCNRSEESSRRVAEAFGIARTAARWQDVVADADLDAVCIGTWPYLHAEVTIAALQHGKHVLTEARMARTLDEARAMEDAARAHPQLVAQVVPSPFTLDYDATVRRLLAEGTLGELREVCVTHTGGALADEGAPFGWRQDFALSGLNVLTLGIYHEIVQRWLEVEPVWVVADAEICTPHRHDPESGEDRAVRIPDTLSVLGRLPGGARMVYHFSALETTAPRNEIRLNGARGCLRVDVAKGELWLAPVGGNGEEPVDIPAGDRRGWCVEADFVRSIREGMPVTLTSFEDGVAYMRFTEAVFRSYSDNAFRTALAGL